MWYVYFLQRNDHAIYVGYTKNLTQRMKHHNDGFVQSTKAFRPLILKSYLAVESQSQAVNLEKYFKSGSGRAVLYKRILSLQT